MQFDWAIAIAGLGVLLIGAWGAPRLSRKSTAAALFSLAVGWTGFGLMAALAWPRIPPATALHDFSATAAAASLVFPGEEKFLANVRQLTFGGQNAEAYFSADGKKLYTVVESTVLLNTGTDMVPSKSGLLTTVACGRAGARRSENQYPAG